VDGRGPDDRGGHRLFSIAQDEIGHARALYELLEGLGGRGADHIALGRPMHGYLNCKLVEYPREDWGFTIARQYLYDAADAVRVAALWESSYRPLADFMAKVAREEKYHLMHTRSWIERLANGSEESRARLERGLKQAYPLSLGVFEPFEGEEELLEGRVLPEPMLALQTRFRDNAGDFLGRFGLSLDPSPPQATAGGGASTRPPFPPSGRR
jgi:ring-1,2-phenylacetyl-CoA epoxidase subunit PaaC